MAKVEPPGPFGRQARRQFLLLPGIVEPAQIDHVQLEPRRIHHALHDAAILAGRIQGTQDRVALDDDVQGTAQRVVVQRPAHIEGIGDVVLALLADGVAQPHLLLLQRKRQALGVGSGVERPGAGVGVGRGRHCAEIGDDVALVRGDLRAQLVRQRAIGGRVGELALFEIQRDLRLQRTFDDAFHLLHDCPHRTTPAMPGPGPCSNDARDA
ncbi:hypothetical protein FHT15_004168 [Xanthomonas campestris]